ncbi:hypothetical protein FCM35_KLT16023 [Carex littledalei]|uniref:Uncharacterized protein n=1 Tax=Carex littledalei TaxID=544730 RepID=A0A833RIQ4_9POAL|nr:hypothetical protein FCM35_KLT16023 [Carex littledalei]
MASSDVPRAQTLGKRKQMETDEDQREEMEIEKLQSELNKIARRVIDYRKTVPDLLAKALRSKLAAQRPIDPPMVEVTTSSAEVHLTKEGLLPEVDEKIKEKLRIFREKSEKNMAAIPDKLKRLKDCIEKIDNIRQINVNVHPVFKMKL